MNLCDIQEVKSLLARHGFHFSKAKGQNFLIQDWVPKEIVRQAGVLPDSCVLEVGPGIGPLTKELCAAAEKVVAVEVDESLRPILSETLSSCKNLTLIFGDVLKEDLPALTRREFGTRRPMACANLPYYITSPILSRLLESRCFSSVTVMVQKEVAERICAAPGTPDYSAFTVFCQYHAVPKRLFDVPPDCFLPRPKVTSSVLRLDLRDAPVCEILDEALFFRVVKASFAVRRKTLLNGLSMGFPQLGKAALSEVIASCGFPSNVRGETLDIPGFALLANNIFRRTAL